MKNSSYIRGAFVLTLTNLFTGVLAFAYRVLLSRTIGPEGIGVYQLIIPLYILFVIIVSGGITTAVSKLVSEYYISGHSGSIKRTVATASLLTGLWSFVICLLIFFNIDFLSADVLKDTRTYFGILAFIPAIIFIPIGAAIKGYFFGLQAVNTPAFIDVLEKVVRLIALVAVSYFLTPYGISYVCAGAMTAMTAGEAFSVVLLMIFYKYSHTGEKNNKPAHSIASTAFRILQIAIPLAIGGSISTILDMANAVIIPLELQAAGYNSHEALSLYGQLTGMVAPLFMFPFIIIVSLSITLVPAVSASFAAKNWAALNKKCNDSVKITSVVALASTALFICYPYDLCEFFFKCAKAGELLYWLSFSCLFIYLQTTLSSLLNGIGLQNKVLVNSIVGTIIVLAFVILLVPVTSIGVYGYIIGLAASSIIVCILSINNMRLYPHISVNLKQSVLVPFGCFLCMIITIRFLMEFGMLISCISGMLIYMLLLLICGTFTLGQLRKNILVK